VASHVLRRFDDDNPGHAGLLVLANILVAGFEPFQNAPDEVLQKKPNALQWPVQKRGGYERKLTALEVAIISESKTFLCSFACQKVVDAVYRGQVVYTPLSFVDILPDHYKHNPISLYDPRKAPLLNQYRLIVPRLRGMIEVCQFAVLLVLYVLAMVRREGLKITIYEIVFCAYATGWILEEFAAIIEHGWKVHTQNLWSFLDITFFLIYGTYFTIRMYALASGRLHLGEDALNILAIAAPVLLPRLAFNLMPDSMLFISLRAMMRDFTVLTLLAIWCFAGFFLSMKWLLDVSNRDRSPRRARPGHHLQMDALDLVWARWDRNRAIRGLPPCSRTVADDRVRFSGQYALSDHSRFDAHQHILQDCCQCDCRDSIPARSTHLRGREK
jgi:hypothetical protein